MIKSEVWFFSKLGGTLWKLAGGTLRWLNLKSQRFSPQFTLPCNLTSGGHLGVNWGILITFFHKQFLHSDSALHQRLSPLRGLTKQNLKSCDLTLLEEILQLTLFILNFNYAVGLTKYVDLIWNGFVMKWYLTSH